VYVNDASERSAGIVFSISAINFLSCFMAHLNAGEQAMCKAQLLQLAREIEIETNIRRMEIARERFSSKTDSVVVVAGNGGGVKGINR
jgi:hypothetical protein